MKIAIAGAGKLGLRIAEILERGDHSITLIDKDEKLIEKLALLLDVATVSGNAKEISLLEEIGISDYDYFITTTDRDEKNIVIGAAAKKLGVPKIIARIRDPEYDNQDEHLKETFGIDYIINPERSIAEEINKYLVEKYSFKGGIYYAGKVGILEIAVDKMPELIDRPVSEAQNELMAEGMSLTAISKSGKLIILYRGEGHAQEDYMIEKEDVLFVVGDREHIRGIAAKIIDKERYTDIQRVMIAGGGKVGYYLARMIDQFGVSVKIIEPDKRRCEYLAAHLPNALILNGDATDIGLLNDENLEDMHAFVSVTGFDEVNLLLALMAKQAGVEDVIAKVSRESFEEIITGMGIDMALSPVDISANHVVRNIEDTSILSSYIIQGQAELLRVVVEKGMKAESKEIGSLALPPGLSIIALQREASVILPDSKTRITEGDRLIILSLLSESFDLEGLLKTKHGFFKS